MLGRGLPAQTKKQKHCHIDRMGDISKEVGDEIPRRFAFSEVAHARHYSSILDTALAYSQHWLRRDDNANKKKYNIMKKEYTSPLAVEVSVAAESMLAASIKIDGNKTVDTSNGGQLSGERRGEWGNLW